MARPRGASTTSETSSHVPDRNQELGSMYDYLAKIILLGPSGAGKSCLLHRFLTSDFRVLSSQTIGVEFSSKIIKIPMSSSHFPSTPNSSNPYSTSARTSTRIKLQLWDTAGTERFRAVSRSYYRGAAGAILVYDVASLTSFNALPTFLMDARALASPELCVVLAGNKLDLADENPQHEDQDSRRTTTGLTPSTASFSSTSTSINNPWSSNDPLTASSLQSNATITPTPSIRSSHWKTPATSAATAQGREVTPDHTSRWASKNGIPAVMEVSALNGENVDEVFHRLARMILTKIELGEVDPGDPRSGVQYGDTGWGGFDDADSVAEGNTLRRRKGGNALVGGLTELGDVFHKPGRKACC